MHQETNGQNDVRTTITDQCEFGLITRGPNGKKIPAKKKTRFMSNAEEILKQLSVRCQGDHEHQPLLDGRAKAAATYPPRLYRAIYRGLVKQLQKERMQVKTLLSVHAKTKIGEAPPEEEDTYKWEQAWDDVTGKELDPKGVREARKRR